MIDLGDVVRDSQEIGIVRDLQEMGTLKSQINSRERMVDKMTERMKRYATAGHKDLSLGVKLLGYGVLLPLEAANIGLVHLKLKAQKLSLWGLELPYRVEGIKIEYK